MLIDSAYEIPSRAIIESRGAPVGTVAAVGPSPAAAHYHECFIRDFVPSALVFMPDGRTDIVNAGLARKSLLCVATLDLFVRILGGVIGNMALKIFATGGLYLGGGIPPRILPRLQKKDFLDAVSYKGRFRDWVARIPVHVILDPKTTLHGAAWDGLNVQQHAYIGEQR